MIEITYANIDTKEEIAIIESMIKPMD